MTIKNCQFPFLIFDINDFIKVDLEEAIHLFDSNILEISEEKYFF